MKKSDAFKSKYLKCADLNGKPIVVTIETTTFETLTAPDGKKQEKLILHFIGAQKTLPLNQINFDSVVDATGEDDSDNWPGRRLELFPSQAQLGAKMVDCVRIRKPDQPALPLKQKPTASAEKPPMADEMDDEIPW